jgi:hypothetical protein
VEGQGWSVTAGGEAGRGVGWETEGGDDEHRRGRRIRVRSGGGNDLIYRGGGRVVGRVVTWADGGLWWVGSVYRVC